MDMLAIGASIECFFTSTLVTMKRDDDGTKLLEKMAIIGVCFSVVFLILQFILLPGLSGAHFGKESYIMLLIWIVIGAVFYFVKRNTINAEQK